MGKVFRTKVVEVTCTNSDGTSRQAIIGKCKLGETVKLKREYDNPADEHAVAVLRSTGEQIGYIAKEIAFRHEGLNDLAPHMDKGGEVQARVVCVVECGRPGFWKRLLGSSRDLGCVIEVEVGGIPYQMREEEARQLKDKGKDLETGNPSEAISLYRQSMDKLIESDLLFRGTYAFKKQVRERGEDPGTCRKTPFPIERITAMLEKSGNYSECLMEIEKYESMEDKKGLSKADSNLIAKRKDRMKKILASEPFQSGYMENVG